MTKTSIDSAKISAFVNARFDSKMQITTISSGEFSQALELSSPERKLILRLNSDGLGFQKDKIIADEFPHIKSPRILETGKFNEETYYALSEKLAGTALREMTIYENRKLLPSLFTHMNSIHTTPLTHPGFGNWDLNLNGQFVSWQERMELYLEKNKWQSLAQTAAFLDIELLQDLENKYLELIKFASERRYFLHGDFGRSNIFANSEGITGIIDWSEAMYGDFLWDVCWIAFWVPEIDYVQEYYEFNRDNKELDLSNFTHRINLYTIVNAIHHMLFAAERNDHQTYTEAMKPLDKVNKIIA